MTKTSSLAPDSLHDQEVDCDNKKSATANSSHPGHGHDWDSDRDLQRYLVDSWPG
nr:hypothetical protein Iba_chr07aCG9100 [Ipomoea batatas]